jgi:hypothetical protein
VQTAPLYALREMMQCGLRRANKAQITAERCLRQAELMLSNGSAVRVENLVCTYSVIGDIVLLCVMKQVSIFLLSEQHNYIYLVFFIVIQYYYMLQLPVSAIIK